MLAGLPASPNESSEHKERVAAPFHQIRLGGFVGAALDAALKAWLQPNR